MKCNKCNLGDMVQKTGKNGLFLACNSYPVCMHTQSMPTENITPKAEKVVQNFQHSPKDSSIVAQCLTKIVFSQEGDRNATEVLSTYRWLLAELNE